MILIQVYHSGGEKKIGFNSLLNIVCIRYYFQNSELFLRILMIMMLFKYESKQTQYFWVVINPEMRIDFDKMKKQSS